MSDADVYERVAAHERAEHRQRRRRRARACLAAHARAYVVVNAALVAVWFGQTLLASVDPPAWWLSTALGWGTGLAVHAALVHRPWRRRHG